MPKTAMRRAIRFLEGYAKKTKSTLDSIPSPVRVTGVGIATMDAQLAVTTATLSGTVTDTSGAVVPQAR